MFGDDYELAASSSSSRRAASRWSRCETMW
jgi:hypothetical protein